ncbi:DUF349 domain-containing protein [Neptuniibacter sp. PT8_73]|uniref:DUF349 domain-containing protein n=1 Tax=Neptuniibacter sp. PT8_73 TaxID=3398206 RepID=UPI0039F5C888
MLARFLKPNWQHAKPEKRIKAIAKLRETDADAQTILSQLALKDEDETVRLSATEKLSDLNLLVQISQNDSSSNIQQLALHRISQILLSQEDTPLQEEKSTALAYITDGDLLTHIALNSQDEQLREQAVIQVTDDHDLVLIAEKSQRASLRVLAAGQINSEEILEQLQKAARNKDKGVVKVTKEKLQIIREQQKQEQVQQEAIQKQLAAIQQLATAEFFPLYSAKMTAIEADWEKLRASTNEEQQEFFQEKLERCSETIRKHDAEQQAEQEKAAQLEQQKAQSHAVYSELCILKEQSTALPADHQQLKSFQSRLESLCTDWTAIKQYSSKDEQASFDKITAQLKNLLVSYFHLLEAEEKIIALCAVLNGSSDIGPLNKAAQEATQLINKFSWPKLQEKPASLVQLEEGLAKAKLRLDADNNHALQLQKELSDVLDGLKSAISSGEIRSADKQIKKAEQLSKRLNGNLTPELEQRIKALGAELQEIRDWQAYAVAPKKESLCEEMEALSQSNLAVQDLATQVRRIQKEWKLLDATDSVHSQQLWKRFKKASDTAYAPCDQHFAQQRDIRKSNLEKRQLILEELKNLQAPQEETVESWKDYSHQIHQAKTEWRNYSPVDRAPGKKLQVQFDQLLKELDAPLKEIRQANAKEKQSLIAETEQLLQATNLHDATEQVKELQKAWKLIGPAPRNQERKLWNQFRENCSQTFEMYFADKSSSKEGSSPSQNSNALEKQCTELEQLIETGASLNHLQELLGSMQQHLPVEDETLSERIEKAINYVQRQKHELKQFESEPYLTIQRKAEICEQLEHAILDETTSDCLDSLREAWEHEPASPSDTSDIDQRFAVLLSLISNPDQMDEMINTQEQRLRHLCIRLEIATSQPSPPEDQALRMEYQMERLQQALAEQKQGFNLSEIKQLEQEWLGIPFAAHFEEFNERFEERLQQLL